MRDHERARTTPEAPVAHRRPDRGRSAFLRAGAVALGLAALSACTTQSAGSPEPQTSGSADAALYVQRDGYVPGSYSNGIGDPQALVARPGSGPAVTYQGTPVIQACNVLSIDDVRSLGLRTEPNQMAGSFERNYFDGAGRGVLRDLDIALPSDPEANACSYQLDADAAISVDVFQPPHITVDALVDEINSGYAKKEPIGELNVYERSDEFGITFIVGRKDTAARLELQGLDPQKQREVLERAAANLVRERSAPAAPPEMVLESPLLDGPVAGACDLLTADDIRSIFDDEVSPLVRESLPMSVGVLAFRPDLKDNYVDSECRREIVKSERDVMTFTTRRADLGVETFTTVRGAEAYMAALPQYHQGLEPVPGVGEHAFLEPTSASGLPVLHVRKGRFVLEVSLEAKAMTEQQGLDALVGLARTAVGRLTIT